MIRSSSDENNLKVFAHTNTEKTPLYRAVMRVFAQAKTRFVLHLRPDDVHTELVTAGFLQTPDRQAVEDALESLRNWGNLEAHPDTADVATVEEFYRKRFLYQLTREGEAAEHALESFYQHLARPGELQTAALQDILTELTALKNLASAIEPDQVKVHRVMLSLCTRFDELTSQAQAFMGSLQRITELYNLEIERFLSYKELLIDYLERFIQELIVASSEIAALLDELESMDAGRLLTLCAERELADALEPTESYRRKVLRDWRLRWEGLRHWFVGKPGAPSQAEVLRGRARSAIPNLLSVVQAINERQSSRSDRPADLRTLARWFAECDSDAEAHRLWRSAFGLCPARHLTVDGATLERWEAEGVMNQRSWLDAPPLLISPKLRATGRTRGGARSRTVIDHTAEKAALARIAREQARQIEKARARLATGRRTRLSELHVLEALEFQLFFDLLGSALSRKLKSGQKVTAFSGDGSLEIILEPTGDAMDALIKTSVGTLRCPDHFITISDPLKPIPEEAPDPVDEAVAVGS